MSILKWLILGVVLYKNTKKINGTKNPVRTLLLLFYTFLIVSFVISYIGSLLMGYGFSLENDAITNLGRFLWGFFHV